jgi:hypothetical protein
MTALESRKRSTPGEKASSWSESNIEPWPIQYLAERLGKRSELETGTNEL